MSEKGSHFLPKNSCDSLRKVFWQVFGLLRGNSLFFGISASKITQRECMGMAGCLLYHSFPHSSNYSCFQQIFMKQQLCQVQFCPLGTWDQVRILILTRAQVIHMHTKVWETLVKGRISQQHYWHLRCKNCLLCGVNCAKKFSNISGLHILDSGSTFLHL